MNQSSENLPAGLPTVGMAGRSLHTKTYRTIARGFTGKFIKPFYPCLRQASGSTHMDS